MITLWEMLENEKADPAHGRPLDLTRIYMANVMSHGDAARLTKEQELHDTEAREAQRADLYEMVAAIAGGKKLRARSRRVRTRSAGVPKVSQRARRSWDSRHWGCRR